MVLYKININNDKYYKKYEYLFNYSIINFNMINNYILYNYLYKNNTNICNHIFTINQNDQIYSNIILKTNKKLHIQNKYYGFTFENLIFNKYNNIKNLIITNKPSNIYNLNLNKNNYDILIYNKLSKYSKEYLTYKNYNIYSSFELNIYKQFLINLKNNNEENNILIPKKKYEFITVHYSYISGLSLMASYKMTLEIPNIISTIAMALKNIAKDGTLLIFWSIVNVNIPVIKKLLSILVYGFKTIEIISNDINQNLLIGVPEYYIKCSGYKANITHDLINKLLDIAIETVEYTYDTCDILDYYENYTEKNPNHSLYYNKKDNTESKKESTSQKSSKSKEKEIKPIYYIEDINIPELDDIMKDSQLQFKVSTLEHKLEGIFIGYFEMVNNYILNAIDTDSKGNSFVKPQAIKQKDITNLTKLINMFEYNKLPYNKHALSVLLEKKDDYTNYLYGLNNTIDTTLVKYNDANTSKLNTSALEHLELFNPYASNSNDSNDALDSYTTYIDKVSISDKVKTKLLEDIEDTTKTNNKDNNYEYEALEDEKEIISKLTKGLSSHIKYLDSNSIKSSKIPITVKDFLSLASTIKVNLGINEFTINNTNDYKVGFIVRKNNRILYDHDEKVNHNKNVFIHELLSKELKKLNIPFKTTSFDNASFEEQAEFLKDVKILIACHGAAFTNLFLLPKNASIMEVSFRRYWYCDPVCQCHVSGQCPYKKDCHTISDSHHYNKKTKKLDYFKGDYYNLSQLFGIGYKEILIEDASGYFKNPGDKDYNPINLTNIYIDTKVMIDKIKKLY
jgi:hypothetical protein